MHWYHFMKVLPMAKCLPTDVHGRFAGKADHHTAAVDQAAKYCHAAGFRKLLRLADSRCDQRSSWSSSTDLLRSSSNKRPDK
mmetsp:Transcript_86763/g.144800  ORF Transcript_86763/g.144800 Transcript_86763/m.144800 type:complete len:82 (-) Transcript_86763:721-966(-)